MPNTLVHIGVQGIATRRVVPDVDPKWIFVGCIIPDVPWILQRVVRVALPAIDPVALRYYADVQGSLIGVLLLCTAIALLAVSAVRIFVMLSLNGLLHLALDALEIKWANGVHLFVPFSWEQVNWGVVWPDNVLVHVLTICGVIYLLLCLKESIIQPLALRRLSGVRVTIIGLVLILYFLAPLLFIDRLEAADNHYLRTLTLPGDRSGKYVEFDRARFVFAGGESYLQGITHERFPVQAMPLDESATVSVRGVLTAEGAVRVVAYHIHPAGVRNAASVVGLLWVLLLWLAAGWYHVVYSDETTGSQPSESAAILADRNRSQL